MTQMPEALPTLWAAIWFLSCVNALVSLERTPFSKTLPTLWHFNSILFLTPPKIRAEGTVPSPSNPEDSTEVPLSTNIQKALIDIVDHDLIIPSAPTVLQNLTNIESYSLQNSTEKKKPFHFPDGGWVCSVCQNYNFCGRVHCNRCGKTKAKNDHVGKPKHLLRKENTENEPVIPQRPKVKRTTKERTGDWLCLACRNVNFAFRQQCNRCKVDKALVGTIIDQKGVMWGSIPQPRYLQPQYNYRGYGMMSQTIPYQ